MVVVFWPKQKPHIDATSDCCHVVLAINFRALESPVIVSFVLVTDIHHSVVVAYFVTVFKSYLFLQHMLIKAVLQ